MAAAATSGAATAGAPAQKDAFELRPTEGRPAPAAPKPEAPSRPGIEQRARAAVERTFALAAQGGRDATLSRDAGREEASFVRRDASGRAVSVQRATREGEGIHFERADWTGQQIVRQRLDVLADGTRVEASESWPSDERGAAALEVPGGPPIESRTERQTRAELPGGEIRERSEVVRQSGGDAAPMRRSSEIVLRGDAVLSARQEVEDGAGRRIAAQLEGGEIRVSVDGRETAAPGLPGFAKMSPRQQERISLVLAALAGLVAKAGGRARGDPREQRLAALLREPAIRLALSRALRTDSELASLWEEGALATAEAQGGSPPQLPARPLWTPVRERAGGGWRIGRYRVLKKLGMGGMGEVFLARAEGERGFEKTLVLKCILPHLADDEEFLEHFLDEARLAARLNHPNIVQIFELGQASGRWYMAMEYVRGADLRRVVAEAQAQSRAMPIGVACRVTADVAAALDYAHRLVDPRGEPMGVVHRDVSPHNILVGVDGAVKLIDFGIAQVAGPTFASARGKTGYIAPELLRGARARPSSDVFSLGVVLWELLARRRLWDAPNEAAMILQISACEIPPPSAFGRIPAELDRICLRALARTPDERFPDAASLRHALEAFAVTHRVDATSSALERFLGDVFAHDDPDEGGRLHPRTLGAR